MLLCGIYHEIIHYLKTGIKESRKRVKVKKGRDPLFDLRNIAVETGIEDLAGHHDYYLYGVSKREWYNFNMAGEAE